MKLERWEEVGRLFSAALEREPARRGAFLAEACAGDDSLRAEVEDLLQHADRSASFMQDPAMDMMVQELVEDSAPSQVREVLQDSIEYNAWRKPRKGAPWWMFAVGAAFLICALVHYYAHIVAPENPGITVEHISDKNGFAPGVAIRAVSPDSASARAGLRPGDLIFAASSDGFIPRDTRQAPLYWKAGRTYHMEVNRGGESKKLVLRLSRDPLSNLATGRGKENLVLILVSVLYLILAAIVAFSRPHDAAARWGGLWLANLAITASQVAFYPLRLGWLSALMSLPQVIGWLAMLVLYSTASNQWIGITFLAVFPRRLFRRPWIWALIWLPAMTVLPVTMVLYPNPMHPFSRWWPDWYDHIWRIFVMLATGTLGLVAVTSYLRLRDLDERRRIRILVVGLGVSVFAALLFLARLIFPLRLDFIRSMSPAMQANFWLLSACLYAVFPVSMAYAILRHRLFDIRVMIRLGLRYAVARGALLALVPMVGVVLAGDLLFHGNQPLTQILGERGLLYVALAGSGFLLHLRRRAWLTALDRRFFREQYNAQQVLSAVVEEAGKTRHLDSVAPGVVSQIEGALHPQFAALFVRQPGAGNYRLLTGGDKAPLCIPADSKLLVLIRALGKPIEIPQRQTGWLWNQLPQQDLKFLRQAGLEWLFPICVVEGKTEALLALGSKRSQEPYSFEDQELLQGITSSLALLLEEAPAVAAARGGFEECPECGMCYDSGSGNCRKEGARLTSVAFPRLLGRRYRFEQRLGQGGMGMVYEALDMELERRVAVKLMRLDLTTSEEAAARFRREAKAAASFTHPNVVTVHDFGVAENQRAYLVMELLHGSTLREKLDRHGRLSPKCASGILEDVCAAVGAAHRRRLVHRDLKPENIFLDSSQGAEIAKILDFGVAKVMAPLDAGNISSQTGPGMLAGTLKYMSPEALRGEDPAESWDLWALAVVAYEMLTGVHPIAASTVFQARDAILACHVIPLRDHMPEAPPAWQQFFDKALGTGMESRPASAIRFLSDFGEAMGGSLA
jgi:hypothetical protein